MFDNFWLRSAVSKEINKAYLDQNISKLEFFFNEGYDLKKIIKTESHPLLDSINLKFKKNISFFLIKYANEKLIEEALSLTYSTKDKESEEIIILFCQKNKIKLNTIYSNYKNIQSILNYSFKYE